ncbi:hypothetical protein [Mycobacteroides chelonae]|uniref:hypothetical protein n=1 Tax=Mycobacteroides chelonae TaxID=1774 RepID=UPI003AAC81B6
MAPRKPRFTTDSVVPQSRERLTKPYRDRNSKTKYERRDPGLEDFTSTTYPDMLGAFSPASEDIAPNVAANWLKIANDLSNASYWFMRGILTTTGWEGEAADAARANIGKSQEEVIALLGATRYMHSVVDTFANSFNYTRKTLVDLKDEYAEDVTNNTDVENKKANDEAYAQATRRLMSESYAPPARGVAEAVPTFEVTMPNTSQPGPTAVAPTNTGGGGNGGGGGQKVQGSGKPPSTTDPQKIIDKFNKINPQANNPSATNPAAFDPSKLASTAADAGKNATSALSGAAKDALGQAASGAQGLLSSLQNANGALPEGVLGLGGPKVSPLSTPLKPGGTSGRVGQPSGGADARPTLRSEPHNSVTKASAASSGSGSRGAASAGTGAAGGGAPAAGSRADGGGKVHKVNKALRTAANGEEILGETDAVVSVIGSTQPDPPPKK